MTYFEGENGSTIFLNEKSWHGNVGNTGAFLYDGIAVLAYYHDVYEKHRRYLYLLAAG